MKKTFTTTLPDKAGAFLLAGKILHEHHLNITRASYQKSIDAHTLFIEVEGTEQDLSRASAALLARGYLQNRFGAGKLLVFELRLPDVSGSMLPPLERIAAYALNISYISTTQQTDGYSHLRLGVFIEDSRLLSRLLREISTLCELSVIEYDKTQTVLDSTVFYLSFANRLAKDANLGSAAKNELCVNANRIMELLAARKKPPYQTFALIDQFAETLRRYRGLAFHPRITQFPLDDQVTITLLEPPCGSNTCVIQAKRRLLVIDSGFACYAAETLAALEAHISGFSALPRELLITHADIDHCGILSAFSRILVSRKCADNFFQEQRGEADLREQNPLHAPFIRISKLLSAYRPPALSSLCVLGGEREPIDGLLSPIARLDLPPLSFEVYEGAGGHIAGEIILIERQYRLLFSGDLYVNRKGFSPAQEDFNRLAPILMTSVDTDPSIAAAERQRIFEMLGSGTWRIFGGHGAAMTRTME